MWLCFSLVPVPFPKWLINLGISKGDGISKRSLLAVYEVLRRSAFLGDGGGSAILTGASTEGSGTGISPSFFSPPWKCPLHTRSCYDDIHRERRQYWPLGGTDDVAMTMDGWRAEWSSRWREEEKKERPKWQKEVEKDLHPS